MTDIDQIPLKLLNDARAEVGLMPLNRMALATSRDIGRAFDYAIDKLIATEQKLHDFKHKVSFAVEDVMERDLPVAVLRRFIIGADKPDALVDVWGDLFAKAYNLDQFCDALEARGLEIRTKANAHSKTD